MPTQAPLSQIAKEDLGSTGSHQVLEVMQDLTHNVQLDVTRKPDWRFWAIFPGLCISSLLTALDATILSTALPTIANDLHSEALYIWALNAYTLTITAVQPFYGQAADIFGRKIVMITAIVLFAVGSGVCGGSNDTTMLISGRVVQGLGGGGLSVLPSLIVCDLVPLRERQMYLGMVYGAFAIGTFIGPVVGGALTDHAGWRWVFYLNLPVAGVALLVVFFFLHVKYEFENSVFRLLSTVDFIGNAILIASVSAILLALTWAGTTYSWRSWRIVVPLVLGLMGLIFFFIFEGSKWCSQPMMPPRLFSNQTSLIAYILTFLHGLILYWLGFFLPVYFQAVLRASPQQSGLNSLASAIPLVPFGIVGGIFIARTGHYKPNQLLGFALTSIGIGCLIVLDENSKAVEWIIFQIILSAGAGIVLTATLPAIQAPLPESDTAATTATWGFVQSFGFIWGSSIPSSIFNSRFTQLLPDIADESIRRALSGGGAYQHSIAAFINSLKGNTRIQVTTVYVASLKRVWQVGVAFAALGFAMSWFLKEIELRKDLETKYGYDDGKTVLSKGEAQIYDLEQPLSVRSKDASRVAIEP